jgi:hypothetical protein
VVWTSVDFVDLKRDVELARGALDRGRLDGSDVDAGWVSKSSCPHSWMPGAMLHPIWQPQERVRGVDEPAAALDDRAHLVRARYATRRSDCGAPSGSFYFCHLVLPSGRLHVEVLECVDAGRGTRGRAVRVGFDAGG